MQNLLISNTEHMNYESKTVPLQIFLIQAPHPKQSQLVKNVATWLPAPTFWKSHGHFIIVSFSIKPGDQTDETESPDLVNKTELNHQR